MNIELLDGQFSANEQINIISQMVNVKVKFHENKISKTLNEEDIKFCEAKIKRLQNDLFQFRKFIEEKGVNSNIKCEINLS